MVSEVEFNELFKEATVFIAYIKAKIKKEYPEGIKADGEVVTINSAGAVIRLEDGIEGLVQEKEQVETLKEKDKVEVSVDKIMERERKFLLSLKKAN